MFELKKLRSLISWIFSGDSIEDIKYLLHHPYLLYKIFAEVRRTKTGKNLHAGPPIHCKGSGDQSVFLHEAVSQIENTFSYVDPKILNWFGEDLEQSPFQNFQVSYYQSQDNLSHSQAQESAKNQGVFKEYSLVQALLIAERAVQMGLLDWPRKYLIIYITDRFEGKRCRILGYSYDDGSIEIFVNQMDPGDVWTPGVGYVFDAAGE